MAQWNSASANVSLPDENAAQHDARPRPAYERGRAAAYLDLWERQLVEAAADGPPRGDGGKRP